MGLEDSLMRAGSGVVMDIVMVCIKFGAATEGEATWVLCLAALLHLVSLKGNDPACANRREAWTERGC